MLLVHYFRPKKTGANTDIQSRWGDTTEEHTLSTGIGRNVWPVGRDPPGLAQWQTQDGRLENNGQ